MIFNGGGSLLSIAENTAKQNLILSANWNIIDGGLTP
jgi:hypothetical protein